MCVLITCVYVFECCCVRDKYLGEFAWVYIKFMGIATIGVYVILCVFMNLYM